MEVVEAVLVVAQKSLIFEEDRHPAQRSKFEVSIQRSTNFPFRARPKSQYPRGLVRGCDIMTKVLTKGCTGLIFANLFA